MSTSDFYLLLTNLYLIALNRNNKQFLIAMGFMWSIFGIATIGRK